jgi:hypothetical protein
MEVMTMKRIQGFIAGFLATCVLLICIPVLAENIAVIFNPLNIAINGEKVASEGENFTLSNGNTVPFSIVYSGTTYVPLKKLAEFTGKTVTLDPVTNTVNLDDPDVAYDPLDEYLTAPAPTPVTIEGEVTDVVTREELARFLAQQLELEIKGEAPLLRDVSAGEPYYNDILIVVSHGMMGATDGFFKPKETVTRFQYELMILRIMNVDYRKFEPVTIDLINDVFSYEGTLRNQIAADLYYDIIRPYEDGTIRLFEPLVFNDTINTDLKSIMAKVE